MAFSLLRSTEMEYEMQITDSHQVTDPSHEDPPTATPSSSSSPPYQSLKVERHLEQSPAPLPSLPQELIVEILSRLPVKSLLKFRCVSKSFKTLISNPQFIKTHLQKIKTLSRRLSERILIMSPFTYERMLKSCSPYSILNNNNLSNLAPHIDAIELGYDPLKGQYFSVRGSCDGLVLVAVEHTFLILWNPSTRVFHRLRDVGFDMKLATDVAFGFGYDSEIDDYKVVVMFNFQNKKVNGSVRREAGVEVCTLRTKYWRRIEDFTYGVPYDPTGQYVNGSLYWPVKPESNVESMLMIVSLDLANETYREVMQPDYGKYPNDMMLGVLDGRLCVMCDYHRVYGDLWVMKQNGVRVSWTKVVSIPYFESGAFDCLVPIYISDGGEVLLLLGIDLLIYNPKDGTFRYPVLNGARAHTLWRTKYIESLVSPDVES